MAKVMSGISTILRRASTNSLRNIATAPQVAPLQEAALQEKCILVDEFDRAIGEASKRDCHTVGNAGYLPLHRAFSVFLFNNKGDLLLQKRSSTKITFPGHYTNTCCSHPLAEIAGETEEHGEMGVRKAAQRRLGYELGIPKSQALPSDFFYLTRIHYQASSGYWGEHEIDYVLFLQKDNVTIDPNPDEVSEIQWVPKSDINRFINNINAPLTPWFDHILKHKLPLWWDNLNSLDSLRDHNIIHKFV